MKDYSCDNCRNQWQAKDSGHCPACGSGEIGFYKDSPRSYDSDDQQAHLSAAKFVCGSLIHQLQAIVEEMTDQIDGQERWKVASSDWAYVLGSIGAANQLMKRLMKRIENSAREIQATKGA